MPLIERARARVLEAASGLSAHDAAA